LLAINSVPGKSPNLGSEAIAGLPERLQQPHLIQKLWGNRGVTQPDLITSVTSIMVYIYGY